MDIKEDAEKHLIWKIGPGLISFWWDNWSGKGALAKITQFQNAPRRTLVNSFIENGNWNVAKLRNHIPNHLVADIINIGISNNKVDTPIWSSDSTGKFSCKSAWHNLRKQRPSTLTYNMIWHKKLLYQISFFVYRMLHRSIPTDDGLKRFRMAIPSRCCCCTTYKEETIKHLFCDSDIARRVWSFFGQSCGIYIRDGDTRQIMMSLWLTKTKNLIHANFLQAVPILIRWEIWKSRCASRYENIHMSSRQIIQQVEKLTSIFISSQFHDLQIPMGWNDMCRTIESAKQSFSYSMVIWKKPDFGWVKLNFDGCCKGNPGSSGGGGIIRDHNGNFLVAYADFYGYCNNNMAEAKSLAQGLSICLDEGYSSVIVESDSQVIINMINNNMKIPWQMQEIINNIINFSKNLNCSFVHIYREGNMVADYFANIGERSRMFMKFNNVNSLPNMVKAFITMDREGTPNFRVKPRRNQFIINDDK